MASTLKINVAKNLSLLLLSIVILPLDTLVLCITLAIRSLWRPRVVRGRTAIREQSSFRRRRILVTGVGMTKGLVLARAFYKAGHDVIGADFEPRGALASGRVSKSLCNFYRLPQPDPADSTAYKTALKTIIEREGVEIWVSCSGVVSAVEDGEAKEVIERDTDCVAIQFDSATTAMLHEKDSFIRHISRLGLQVPDTHTIRSSSEALATLSSCCKTKKYILKPIGVDDARRADMTLLPFESQQQTSDYISKLGISKMNSYILQQYVRGKEYCTQALVVRGQVLVFVACPSSDLLMHYEALPADSPLSMKMYEFTKKVAGHGGDQFTGHLSFDFLVEDDDDESLYPIECNPRCHTAVVLFGESSEALSAAYISALDCRDSKDEHFELLTPQQSWKYYWLGNDLITMLLLPLFRLFLIENSVWSCLSTVAEFLEHLLLWKDGTFEPFDPWPWFWLYHVYWPIQFFNSIAYSQSWSRINVSTTKMFQC